MRFPLLGLTRDLHPLGNTHTEHIKKGGLTMRPPQLFFELLIILH